MDNKKAMRDLLGEYKNWEQDWLDYNDHEHPRSSTPPSLNELIDSLLKKYTVVEHSEMSEKDAAIAHSEAIKKFREQALEWYEPSQPPFRAINTGGLPSRDEMAYDIFKILLGNSPETSAYVASVKSFSTADEFIGEMRKQEMDLRDSINDAFKTDKTNG